MAINLSSTSTTGTVNVNGQDILTADASGNVSLRTRGQVKLLSTITPDVIGDAPVFACRAWVNFNGTGTVAIRASGNVSSITDNGTGDYTVNFTTPMQDANYATFVCTRFSTDNVNNTFVGSIANITNSYITTSVRIYTQSTQETNTRLDSETVTVSIFR